MRNYLLAALACTCAAPAGAATVFEVILTTDQEAGPVNVTTGTGDARSVPYGQATLSLTDDFLALSYIITIYNIDVTGFQTSDINDNIVAAHFHAAAPPLNNAGVVFGFFGAPFNETSPNDLVVTPLAGGVGGVFQGIWNGPEGNNTTLASQVANLQGGLAYLNFHTIQNPGGEIRGNIPAVSAGIPEPSTWAMLLLGFFAIGGAVRSAKRKTKATVSYV